MATDDELITGCRAGAREAWEEVHRRYHRLIWSIARSNGLSAHDAEEIVQVTMMVFQAGVERLRPGSRLAPWLSTVARRHTWRLVEKRRREAPTAATTDVAGSDDPADSAVRMAEDEALRLALAKLPSGCRCLLEALYLTGGEVSYADVAADLDIPIGSIGPTRSRCLDRLRKLLAELDTTVPEPTRGSR